MSGDKLYERMAVLFNAIGNCRKSGNAEWERKHRDRLDALVKDHMPSGSGIDSGTQFDEAASSDNKLVFRTAFHHMNDAGMYDGWTQHTVTVRPSLAFGIEISVRGRNRNDILEYLHGTFYEALTTDAPRADK